MGPDPLGVHKQYWSAFRALPIVDDLASLPPKELMATHHAACMALFRSHGLQVADVGAWQAPRSDERDMVRATTQLLLREESRFVPRRASIWTRGDTPGAPPSTQGELVNASVSHLGALEVLKLDPSHTPIEARTIDFAALRAVLLADAPVYRPARLQYRDASEEWVWIPLLYGTSYETDQPSDIDGSMTRFVCHLGADMGRVASIGVGHQDLYCGDSLVRLGAIRAIVFE